MFKILPLVVISCLVAGKTLSQDTSRSYHDTTHVATYKKDFSNSYLYKKDLFKSDAQNKQISIHAKNHIYRDTRLGSSSLMYNTYKKNDYGAGAITTNTNK